MAWIELHQSLTTHKKTRRLARKLGLGVPEGIPQTIGHLCLFWLWCVDGTEDGSLADLDAQDIADAAGWTGEAETFLDARIEAEFIEKKADGRLEIHDWNDYIGKLIKSREESREKERLRKQKYRQQRRAEPEEDYSFELNPEDIDPEWLKVVKAYESNIGLLPIGQAGDDLQGYYEKLGADIVCEAIRITNKAQANNPWKYLNAILKKWEETGIDTLDKAIAYTKDLERRIEQAKKKQQKETANDPPAITGKFY